MLIIGLTGGIGSGKTTVANLFAAHGVPVIDTDEIARRLTEPGQTLLTSIRQQFGDEVFNSDDSLNRAALAARVFNNTEARQQLEGILHPAIRAEADRQIQSLDFSYCLLVIPLLLETKQNERVDRILVIDTTEKLQISRTLQRDQRSEDEISAIMQVQVGRQARLAAADDIIDNTEKPALSLEEQVNALHQKYLALAQQAAHP